MDNQQANHLKAYGIAYKVLKDDQDVDWLLNYRGGSFLMKQTTAIETECRVRGVSFETISDAKAASIRQQLADPDVNMNVVTLQKAAKIIVYSPIKVSPAEFENTDAVLLVLTYAEIPYEVVYDEEVLKGDLAKYDWLHLHHEDFTGQYGRNMHRQSLADIKAQEDIARKYGYAKVSQMKLAVAKGIKAFCAGGATCLPCVRPPKRSILRWPPKVSILWAAVTMATMWTPMRSRNLISAKRLRLATSPSKATMGTGAFPPFRISIPPADAATTSRGAFFELFNFSAKWDVIPAMLTQNHESIIKEFFGQTTAFRKGAVKPSSLVMGESKSSDRYLYGEMGRGQWTFYGGHDPEGTRGAEASAALQI